MSQAIRKELETQAPGKQDNEGTLNLACFVVIKPGDDKPLHVVVDTTVERAEARADTFCQQYNRLSRQGAVVVRGAATANWMNPSLAEPVESQDERQARQRAEQEASDREYFKRHCNPALGQFVVVKEQLDGEKPLGDRWEREVVLRTHDEDAAFHMAMQLAEGVWNGDRDMVSVYTLYEAGDLPSMALQICAD